MEFLYRTLVPLGALALMPIYAARSLRHPGYRAHVAERLGLLPPALLGRLRQLPRQPVWIQAVSVGEVMLARGLMRELARARETLSMVLSSTTPAGRDTAASIPDKGLAGVFHFPIDWSPCLRRTLDAVSPSALVTIEAEIWPGLLAECGRRDVPVLLVNGRISERSRSRLGMLGGWLRNSLESIRVACMQSEADAERARALGIPPDRVKVTGNMKFDLAGGEDGEDRFDLPVPADSPVIVAGSTSPGEEEAVLDAFARLRGEGFSNATLVLAPRHRERFDEVARMLADRGVAYLRRSAVAGGAGAEARTETPVILLDTLGELASAYGLATVAFVGGSLVPRGGQNLIEPAARGVPVVFGRHIENFERIAEALLAAGAGFRVSDPRELASTLASLLADPAMRRRAGSAGRELVETHRGATERTLHHILPFIG